MQHSDDFIGQRQRRIEKIQELQKLGIDAYPAQSVKTHDNADIATHFDTLENTEVTVTGRLMNWRDHGKIRFADLRDQSGSVQLYMKKDTHQEDLKNGSLGWEKLNLIDAADFVEATGTVTKTSSGQISVLVSKIRILAKAIRPLPNTFTDKEQQFRRRYLDLVLNTESQERFMRKARFWQVSREYMYKNGFIEVEVPVLEHVTGGADARPFITHHNDLDEDFFLRISTELYQKRLIGGGYEKIFTLGPNFRNEGLSDEHLQEYSQLEWYWAYADHRDNMELVKNLVRHIAKEVYGKTEFSTRGHTFDLANEWEEIDYAEVIKKTHNIDIFTDSDEKMKAKLDELGIDLPGAINRNRLIDNLWKTIRKTLAGPAFLINEPKFMSPLAKSRKDNPELTERFHIIIGGSELGNGYSEINDPQDQLNRFIDQQAMRDGGDDEAQMLDVDFVEMLEYGMPPTSGYGHSERVFWFLEDVTAREGTFFPQLKFEVDPMTRKIYGDMLKAHNITLDKAEAGQATQSKQPAEDIQLSITRDAVFAIVDSNIQNKNLVKHCLAVEAAMRGLAEHFGENQEVWSLLGLVHDADWEVTANEPEKHALVTAGWLKDNGETNESFIQALLSHNHKLNSAKPPKSRMEWALYTCDELTGLITATALVTPEKKLSGISVESVQKKFKSKNFAAAIDREQIALCEEKLGIPLDSFIGIILKSMQNNAEVLGL